MRDIPKWSPVALVGFALAILVPLLAITPANANGGAVRYTKEASFDDALFDLNNALVDAGIKVDSNGRVAAMLKRTGADVGSTKAIYKDAQYFTFCSAKLSRLMMEADAGNVAYCPFVMFIYTTEGEPGKAVIGYKTLPETGNAASVKAFKAVNEMLDKIAKQAVE